MPKVISAAAKLLFWECWNGGMSVDQAAQQAGFCSKTAYRIIQEAGVVLSLGRPVKDSEAVGKLIGLIQVGVPSARAARQCGLGQDMGRYWKKRWTSGMPLPPCVAVHVPPGLVWQCGGMKIDMDAPIGYRLCARERETIAQAQVLGWTVTRIAKEIGRPKSTVSRELARNRSKDGHYRLLEAERSAQERAKRPKQAKLACPETPLFRFVANNLKDHLSPEQISHRLVLEHPDDKEMRVCAETIYQAVYVHAKGLLKLEVDKTLRSGRTARKPHATGEQRRPRFKDDMTPLKDRPAEVENRDIPGHWEADLILGSVASRSAVATVVERVFRYTMLASLPHGHTADQTQQALVPLFQGLPQQLRRTLTFDQGAEFANHLGITAQTGVKVYFAEPHSPWQRGTNENTNGLLRQYLPKGTDLSIHTDEEITAIATSLNSRPRKTLGWLTPAEALAIWLGATIIIGGRVMKLPDNIKALADCCDDR